MPDPYIHRFQVGTPEADFFSQELRSFILRAQAQGLGAGEAASCAVCMAGYIAAAYVHAAIREETVEKLSFVLRAKTTQAALESARDREGGRLPPWPPADRGAG